jgi:hypothetical protein
MGTHHPNYRRVKEHLSYSVDELACLFNVHKNTVRGWFKDGLTPIDDARPVYFKGRDVSIFLENRRKQARRPTGVGLIYCLPCRTPRRPDGDMVDFVPGKGTNGRLKGICPDCDRMMFRAINRKAIAAICETLDVRFPNAEP